MPNVINQFTWGHFYGEAELNGLASRPCRVSIRSPWWAFWRPKVRVKRFWEVTYSFSFNR